ncbi:MAG: glycoside hydrolase 43 family protein [candidate division KSB1 bacterium]|nr:glycoside hydrolase 43 family protein [candidate division KSB1 bacterium]
MWRTGAPAGMVVALVFVGGMFVPRSAASGQERYVSRVWVADNGDGSYTNPVLHADYSDPDAIRVGDTFYLVASSFNCVPGLPILRSWDLVNWSLVGYALPRLSPEGVYGRPRHGRGVWAPSIRFHDGYFYIYYADPDFGIYMIRAKRPEGPWSEPILVKDAPGWIDPCPLWDEDGRAYLVHAFARSVSGIKSILAVSPMSWDGTRLLGDPVIVFDGHDEHPTVEGPKFYKRGGYYYIFAPAGGVPTGWQLVLRSRHVFGPYEARVVLAQGATDVNGPHQGAWVDTPTGEHWFLHFQDKGPYGRVVHLQPVCWIDGWPVIGEDADGDGVGQPVKRYRKPRVRRLSGPATPPESDEFDGPNIGLQWQWHANPSSAWAMCFPARGVLRLYCEAYPEEAKNLWDVPNLLLQKFPAPAFLVTVKVDFRPLNEGDRFGLVVMGRSYSYVALVREGGEASVAQFLCEDAESGAPEREVARIPAPGFSGYLRLRVGEGAECQFEYSSDGLAFVPVGARFVAQRGVWIGAKFGLLALCSHSFFEKGFADVDWVRVGKD